MEKVKVHARSDLNPNSISLCFSGLSRALFIEIFVVFVAFAVLVLIVKEMFR